MGSHSGDLTPVGQSARMAGLTDADRAFLLAGAALGDRYRRPDNTRKPDDTVPDFLAGFRDRLSPDWFQTLRGALDRDMPLAGLNDPPRALDKLRRMHQAMARVDLSRVHPSWLVRALREESPAVQRLVAASLAASLRDHLQAGLLLDSRRPGPASRPAVPEVASWVMALWTERLVGGEAERADDSPAIIVLAGLSPRTGYRICRLAGFCKLILAGEPYGDRRRHETASMRGGMAQRPPGKRPTRTSVSAGASRCRDPADLPGCHGAPIKRRRIGTSVTHRSAARRFGTVSFTLGAATLAIPRRQTNPNVDTARRKPARAANQVGNMDLENGLGSPQPGGAAGAGVA